MATVHGEGVPVEVATFFLSIEIKILHTKHRPVWTIHDDHHHHDGDHEACLVNFNFRHDHDDHHHHDGDNDGDHDDHHHDQKNFYQLSRQISPF